MQSYSCGFLFATGLSGPRVLLIRKARPTWQAGLLNGVGGKIEPGESAYDCMVREFREEAGATWFAWNRLATLTGDAFEVSFFYGWSDGTTFDHAQSMTYEPLERVAVADLPRCRVVPNLRVLIPLALDESGIVKPVWLRDERAIPASS